MFARIARRYDRLNAVMSGGRHHAWRRMAVELALRGPASPDPRTGVIHDEGGVGPALDVATGTGDFAHSLARSPGVTGVVGVDPVPEMLALASVKARRNRLSRRAGYLMGDAHELPFSDGRFVCATVGFGVRNFVDAPRALSEMARVVRPGGRVVVLEIVRMDGRGPLSRIFPLYFRYVTPWLGAVLAGDREAYTYLPESVQGFLSATELAAMMEAAGLRNVVIRRLALGAVAIIAGEKAV